MFLMTWRFKFESASSPLCVGCTPGGCEFCLFSNVFDHSGGEGRVCSIPLSGGGPLVAVVVVYF